MKLHPKTLRIVIAIVFIAVGLYLQWSSSRPGGNAPATSQTPVSQDEGNSAEGDRSLPEDSEEARPVFTEPKAATSKTETGDSGGDTAPDAKQKKTPERAPAPAKPEAKGDGRIVVKNVKVRDLDGDVVLEGEVDLTETVERIRAGEKLSRFRHDGITFENREKKLPAKPKGYYHEYVHPTPGVSGPGPQRIVAGESGEMWYTYDHYRTFEKIAP
ncbi:MAG: ribonuclease domain-containing protein [Planctomycetaceae bacterium]